MPGLVHILLGAPPGLSPTPSSSLFSCKCRKNPSRRLLTLSPESLHNVGAQLRPMRGPLAGRSSAAGVIHHNAWNKLDQSDARRISVVRSCSSSERLVQQQTVGKEDLKVLAIAVATVVLATGNKILYKMALVPMKEYPFFLAQLTTFGYVLVYFTILFFRYKAGIVTKEMLKLPKQQFAAMGALEALGLASGMASAAVLPAASLPVLMQVFLVWQLILSATFLGKRYSTEQILGCLLVVAGVIIVVASSSGAESLQLGGLIWPLVMVFSSLCLAASSILKEGVFKNSARYLKGGSVDIFVVNSFGSGFQALFVLLLLPFLSNTRGIPFNQLLSHFKDGSGCLLNAGSLVKGCEGAPLVPVLYVLANMSFNIANLSLLKSSSAIVSSLASTLAVPLAIYAFTLPLPYLGTPPPPPPGLLLGSSILVVGLATYNWTNVKKQAKQE